MSNVQINGTSERVLPSKRNPLLAPEKTQPHSELIAKRRLGQTNLAVKPGQVGTSNATKPENLGPFDYAHLRAPLPRSLKGSEIFAPHQNQPTPEVYFLMRRSTDGYVSATGMFKAAFPWAKHAEENAERDYVKSLPSTAQDEVAGNVWVSELYAIELAQDYGIVPWIHALLDEAPISQGTDDPATKAISPPPKFTFTANDRTLLPPPNGTTARASTPKARGRPRGTSPAKNASPGKPSTKKPRASKAAKEADAASAREASASLQATLDHTAPDGTSTAEPESADGENVKIRVESSVEIKGDTERGETTTVNIEMPTGFPELPLPERPEEMIETARAMVEEARKADGEGSSSKAKRKAEEMDEESDGSADNELQPAKKARLLGEELKKEKVRTRALLGVAATLVIGAIIPLVLPG
ncbi:hypothetical protein HO173_013132 [Letharia columbiana]|uniref:HTH APSES-type domain-containing protein n=1 Tax=Letharia columbiana TaxID=112416 RepID=A0A8H6CIK1_9LECA|nr:uncharacterized protein HO173_013132 [Letharia columbiana]KAF6223801.1 hypothetical protein HO173_013132 [Letharia columbiana]